MIALKKLFIPHQHNNFHPHAVRIHALVVYVVIAILLNYMLVPIFGWSKIEASNSSISTSRLVDLLNYTRTSSGLNGLSIDEKLVNAAAAKAIDMFSMQYWSHFGQRGQSPWEFIKGSGYSYTYAGENLGRGFKDADSLHSAWLNSSSHKANILKKEYKNVGIAAVSGKLLGEDTILVVQMFGSPLNESDDLSPKITYPLDESRVNTKDFEIKGSVKGPASIDVYDKDKKLGSLLSEGGIFTYALGEQSDGDHLYSLIQTQAEGLPSNIQSKPVNVKIDTYPNLTSTKSIALEAIGNNINLTGSFSNDVKSIALKLKNETLDITSLKTNTYTLPRESFNGLTEARISIIANSSEINFNLPLANADGVISPLVLGTTTDTFNFLGTLTIKQKINLAIALFIFVIFVIDAVVLWKLKILRHNSRSLLNAQHMFFIVILILVGTGITGGLIS